MFHRIFRRKAHWVAALALSVCSTTAFAQAYPNAPIRLVVPYAAGGSADVYARLIGKKMTDAWGKQVVVDNRPGAGGTLGAGLVAKAPADGYTMLLAASPFSIAPTLFPKQLTYDSLKDFTPVTLLAFEPNILLVHPSLRVGSVGELIKLAKARPGQVHFASSGNGTTTHLSGEMFKTMAALDINHVPYKGNPPAITDLVSGRVGMMFLNASLAVPLAQTGKVKPVAITSGKRTAALPDLPTVSESGIPGYESGAWFGIMVPAGAPADVVNKLHAQFARIMRDADMLERLAAQGSEPIGDGPEPFAIFVRRDIEKWAKVVRDSGAKAD